MHATLPYIKTRIIIQTSTAIKTSSMQPQPTSPSAIPHSFALAFILITGLLCVSSSWAAAEREEKEMPQDATLQLEQSAAHRQARTQRIAVVLAKQERRNTLRRLAREAITPNNVLIKWLNNIIDPVSGDSYNYEQYTVPANNNQGLDTIFTQAAYTYIVTPFVNEQLVYNRFTRPRKTAVRAFTIDPEYQWLLRKDEHGFVSFEYVSLSALSQVKPVNAPLEFIELSINPL